MSNNKPGVFISFEGVDGAGKTSHMQRVKAHLESLGISCLQTREPGGTEVGEAIRALVLHQNMDIHTELLLMYAARRQHVEEVIQPALARGVWVISDRFEDSSFAYQGNAGGVWDECQTLSAWALNGFEPNLTFLFDLPIEVSQARIQQRAGQSDKFEEKPHAYVEAVRAGFLRRAEQNPKRVCVIDAQCSESDVGQAVLAALSNFLNNKQLKDCAP
jgi:dTMP kinase